jgi:hypothetical protein
VIPIRPTQAPARAEEYTSLPFKKVINPAFADEVAGKWIRCRVVFQRVLARVIDLPGEYKKDWVRIMVGDAELGSQAMTMYVVVPKSKSDEVFDLKQGDEIELFAYLVPVRGFSGITGRGQSGVLFQVEKIQNLHSNRMQQLQQQQLQQLQQLQQQLQQPPQPSGSPTPR